MTTQVNFKIDPAIKKKASERAEKEGLSYSSFLQMASKAYAEEKLDISVISRPEIPNARTAKRWAKIDKEIAEGKGLSPAFDNAEDAIAHLKKEVARYRKLRK